MKAAWGTPADPPLLLWTELLPVLPGLAGRARPEGRAILSGLLAEEREAVETAAARVGLVATDARHGRDAFGDDWIARICSRQ